MRKLALLLIVLLVVAGLPMPKAPASFSASQVGVQLFMWNWNSVAKECKTELGPAGYDWVLVMPPQEHLKDDQWWVHYQPVSYKIESRLGTREEFAAMVSACNKAGVKVIADAVINHMLGRRTGTGWLGESFTKYSYPGLYNDNDFHPGRLPIGNWNDQNQVQNYELLSLSDLATEKSNVRQKIADYLKDLLSLGVYGFRIDAARHIPVDDLAAIKAKLPSETYFLQEVAGTTNPPIEDYLKNGDVWEFAWPALMKKAFSNAIGVNNLAKRIKASNLIDSKQAVTMVTNHDTERNGAAIALNNPLAQQLAYIYTLASTYGSPMMYSGYAFDNTDAAPALLPDGRVADVVCANDAGAPLVEYQNLQFACQHRWKAVEGMIAWRDAAGKQKITEQKGDDGIFSLGRGSRAHLVLNTALYEREAHVQTQLAPGEYCDLISGGRRAAAIKGKCLGATITVDSAGYLDATLASMGAIAISKNARLN